MKKLKQKRKMFLIKKNKKLMKKRSKLKKQLKE